MDHSLLPVVGLLRMAALLLAAVVLIMFVLPALLGVQAAGTA